MGEDLERKVERGERVQEEEKLEGIFIEIDEGEEEKEMEGSPA